jgi:hypothetical protein
MTNLIVGLVSLALGAWGAVAWWNDVGLMLRGLVPVLLIMFGLAGVGAGMCRGAVRRPQCDGDSAS